MSAAAGSKTPAVVSVRLTGDPDACARLALIVTCHPGLGVVGGPRGPYACDSGPGVRWYLTVRHLEDPPVTGTTLRQASAQPPATPLARRSQRRHRP
jgi:hypothetical protein